MARQRHPGEPIADLHRRYEAGGAAPSAALPPRCRRPPRPGPPLLGYGLADTPCGGRGFRVAAPTLVDMEENAVRRFAATFVTDTTNPPTPRPRRLRHGRYDLVEVADVIIALICFGATNSTLTNANANHHGHHSTG